MSTAHGASQWVSALLAFYWFKSITTFVIFVILETFVIFVTFVGQNHKTLVIFVSLWFKP